jgi:hypothetical protein
MDLNFGHRELLYAHFAEKECGADGAKNISHRKARLVGLGQGPKER